MTDVASLKEILRKEYGICNVEELDKAIEESGGIDIGIFTSTIERSINDEKKAEISA